ncbi:MAG: Asp-tRNA(Asn)/Glu-tRNA(Gln) amidotransferase subunit GatC [Kiritimatiellae bacterium]|jgi:aspartyl-tRNA(Asn)/glutamyl-tRNA(Gln) amidotransferase subunit C|nr:Asp-tRNA(Asn)/Glu-tRNA(Gln) amidotransferase subunit GatC [Kiritimatiellia bacterium]
MNEKAPDLDHVDVTYVAKLARIELSAEETERFQSDLDAVLAYIHQLNELDLEGVEPMSHPGPRKNVLREDVVTPGPDREEMIGNAPATIQGLVRVPQMMEDS